MRMGKRPFDLSNTYKMSYVYISSRIRFWKWHFTLYSVVFRLPGFLPKHSYTIANIPIVCDNQPVF